MHDSNRSSVLQIWLIGALVPLAFMLTGDASHRDFDLLWAAAKLALSGEASEIYHGGLNQVLDNAFAGDEAAIFPYPPHSLFFILPFAALPRFPAFLAWDAITLAFFYWAAGRYLPRGFPPIFAVLTPAALTCLDFGQTGLLLGALWLLAFRGKWAAVSLLTFKPHLGFLSVLTIRDWPTLLRVALLVLSLIVISAAVFGISLWPAFVDQVMGHGARMSAVQRWLFAGVGPAMAYGLIGWVPFAAAGGILLARNINVFTASTASFLISPFAFHYDMTVASLGFGLLVACNWQQMPIRHRIPVALGFLAPVVAVAGAWWVPPLLLWALWVQVQYDPPGRQDCEARPNAAG